jgi:hypothetical protein
MIHMEIEKKKKKKSIRVENSDSIKMSVGVF